MTAFLGKIVITAFSQNELLWVCNGTKGITECVKINQVLNLLRVCKNITGFNEHDSILNIIYHHLRFLWRSLYFNDKSEENLR
jgi:hypothetical protein